MNPNTHRKMLKSVEFKHQSYTVLGFGSSILETSFFWLSVNHRGNVYSALDIFLYKLIRLDSSNGRWPANNSKRITPEDQTSAAAPSYTLLRISCSRVLKSSNHLMKWNSGLWLLYVSITCIPRELHNLESRILLTKGHQAVDHQSFAQAPTQIVRFQ